MKRILLFFAVQICFISCTKEMMLEIDSPNKEISVQFSLGDQDQLFYTVFFQNKMVIDSSYLGFDFVDAPHLGKNLIITDVKHTLTNESWEMPWGEQSQVQNTYNELKLYLTEQNEPKRKFTVVFKVYDDGLGFRYEFPEQKDWKEALIKEEHTEFQLTRDYTTYWIPGDWDIYEHLYSTTKLSQVNALKYVGHTNLAQTHIPENAVNTPVTMVGDDGVHLSFHEAALVDYAGMTLKVDTTELKLQSHLVGSENSQYKVKRELPFYTPWRTIQISKDAPGLIASNLIVNLNEPNKLGDISWFQPMKYTGVWWEMHLGKSSWDYGMVKEDGKWVDRGKTHGRHGATTENVKRFIDFSAKNNIKGVLVEGWNTGWEQWIGFDDREGVFDFVTTYPDYNLREVVRYAQEKGVEIIMHHETSAATETYTRQQDTAFALMKLLDIHSVKTGYVGKILPKGEYHHGQYMVNHYNKTVEKAAGYQVAINAHEPIKATGLRRTYPNTISREGLRGQEFNAWAEDGGNPPEHLSIVAFTRMLAGPIDFTPGIFNIKLDGFKENNQVNTTITHQLALYVVIYSPVQMAADLVEHYEAQPEPLQFIRDVGVNWSETRVLNGKVGDFVTIARKEKGNDSWFVGGITDEKEREMLVPLDFLDPDQSYQAIIYKDADNAHWDLNPVAYKIEKQMVNSNTILKLKLAPGGGFAISLVKN